MIDFVGRYNAPKNYGLRFVKRAAGPTLVVALSPTSRFAMFREPIDDDTLFVTDGYDQYYSRFAGRLSIGIRSFAMKRKYERVILVGSSKAGFGALLIAALIELRLPKRFDVSAIAFSPQTQLYPYNYDLYFPSYKRMMANIETDDICRQCLEKYGDLRALIEKSALRCLVVYGERNAVDRGEAERLRGARRVEFLPLDTAVHGASMAFTVLHRDRADFAEQMQRVFEKARTDPDLMASLPRKPEELAKEFLSFNVPTLNYLVKNFSHAESIANYRHTIGHLPVDGWE